MQDNTVARLQSSRIQTALSSLLYVKYSARFKIPEWLCVYILVVEIAEDATIPEWLCVFILVVVIAEKMQPSLYGYVSLF
jgi:hypothetical protein